MIDKTCHAPLSTATLTRTLAYSTFACLVVCCGSAPLNNLLARLAEPCGVALGHYLCLVRTHHYLRCIDVLPFPGNAPLWSDGVRKSRPEFCLPYRLCKFSCACIFAFFPHGRDESVYQVQCLSSSMSSLTSDKACNLGGVILSNRWKINKRSGIFFPPWP